MLVKWLKVSNFEMFFGVFNSPKKRTKTIGLEVPSSKIEFFHCFFGRIEDTKKTFWNWLTFSVCDIFFSFSFHKVLDDKNHFEFICFFLSMFLGNFSQSFRAGALSGLRFLSTFLHCIGHDLIVIKNVRNIILFWCWNLWNGCWDPWFWLLRFSGLEQKCYARVIYFICK